MDTFDSSNPRHSWSNYPPECYATNVDYYRSYGTARKSNNLIKKQIISVFFFKHLHPFHGLTQVNIPSLIGHHKHHHHFLIPLLNLQMLTQILSRQHIHHHQHHLVNHITLQHRPKTFHMKHYLIHRINNNIIIIFHHQQIHPSIIIIGDMFLKILLYFGQQ
jgi:hypothetical protein